MTTTRTYRYSLSISQAAEEIKSNASKQFDPLIVKAMNEIYETQSDFLGKIFKKKSSRGNNSDFKEYKSLRSIKSFFESSQ